VLHAFATEEGSESAIEQELGRNKERRIANLKGQSWERVEGRCGKELEMKW
jgi:hypothetical protein